MSVCKKKDHSNSRSPKSSVAAIQRRCQKKIEQAEARCSRLQQQVDALQDRLRGAEAQLDESRVQLFVQSCSEQSNPIESKLHQRPIAGHQFSPWMIAMAILLAKRCGFRAAADAIRIMLNALGIDLKTPSHDAIEQWMLRLGVSNLQNTFTHGERVLWMADHSCQVGKQKLLLIIGVALEDLPQPNEMLSFDKMKILAVVPGDRWKTEDVRVQYEKLAAQIGPPVFLLCDGANELRDSAEGLGGEGFATIVLGDLKHRAANIMKHEIGSSERFNSFVSQAGKTTRSIVQTELSHFSPPGLKAKSRFMNLGPLLNWAGMILHFLDHPESKAWREIDRDRLQEKFGWLQGYAEDVARWRCCQQMVEASLKVIHYHGFDNDTASLVKDATEQLLSGDPAQDRLPARVSKQLVDWVQEQASKLPPKTRSWLSTEILESLFGRFKHLSKQHSKGSFTRLIGAIGALCGEVTGDSVRAAFERLTSPQLQAWIKESLGTTSNARRNAAYHEYRQQTNAPPAMPA